MAQVVDARPGASGFPQAGRTITRRNVFPDCGIHERLPVIGYEHCLGKGLAEGTFTQVSVQRSLGGLMQRNRRLLPCLDLRMRSIIARRRAFK
jgi:hypothetical protein